MAIKELQDAYGKIAVNGRSKKEGKETSDSARSGTPSNPSSLRRDIDECKIAIKKLAESVTTVKNVLDRRIQEEIRKVSVLQNFKIYIFSENKMLNNWQLVPMHLLNNKHSGNDKNPIIKRKWWKIKKCLINLFKQ